MKQILNQKLTAKDVLNIFIEEHKIFSHFDVEADPNAEINSNSTIKDWRDANDLLPWYKLYPFLNEKYNMDFSEEVWKEILEPEKTKKLMVVCEFIAKNSKYTNIESIKLFGNECLEAAVFRRLKENLEKKNVTNIKPSSKLSDYLDEHLEIIITEILHLSKGKKIIDKIERKRQKEGFLNYINVFDKNRFIYSIPQINTFKDLIFKIIKVESEFLKN